MPFRPRVRDRILFYYLHPTTRVVRDSCGDPADNSERIGVIIQNTNDQHPFGVRYAAEYHPVGTTVVGGSWCARVGWRRVQCDVRTCVRALPRTVVGARPDIESVSRRQCPPRDDRFHERPTATAAATAATASATVAAGAGRGDQTAVFRF